jgi:hypothetical protein
MDTRTAGRALILSLPLLALAACGGGSSGDDDGGQGQLSVGVTDAPVDGANRVVVEFTGIELKPQSGPPFEFNFTPPLQIDLLALQGDEFEPLLVAQQVPAGRYNWMRLKLNDNDCAAMPPGSDPSGSFIELSSGGIEALHVPSGNETGLKLVSGFTVAAGGLTEFTVDFDLRKSVIKPTGQPCHFLRPALRLVDNAMVGTLRGTVDAALLGDPSCSDTDPLTGNAVYLFQNADVVPDDVDGIAPDPLTSAIVNFNTTSGQFEYEIGFVLAGPYTVALTCEADLDNPDTDDPGVGFLQSANVTVTADSVTTHNFTAAPTP